MTTIRGVYIGRALDVIIEQSGYPDEARYDLWDDLRLFVQNNFDEYLTRVLRVHADNVLPEHVRYDIIVFSQGFNQPPVCTVDERPEVVDYFRVGDVTFRSARHSFSFRFGMPTTAVLYSPYELKRFLVSIETAFSHHLAEADYGVMSRRLYGATANFGIDLGMHGITRDNARARELLLSQCTESQVREYEKNKSITVYGEITGNKYRIRHAYQINVDVMDRDRVMYKLCTVADPELNEDLPIEDNMLAQKTMIELNEREFLQIAKRW